MTRLYRSGNPQLITLAPLGLRDHTQYSFITWFNSPDNSGGDDFAFFYLEQETGGFPIGNSFRLDQDGTIKWFDRDDGSASTLLISANTFDDNKWHWICGIKRANNDRELFVDGVSEATSADVVDADGVPDTFEIGSIGSGHLIAGARQGRVVRLPGVALSLAEATDLAFNGPGRRRYNRRCTWYELNGSPSEPEFFNNGTPGVVSGMDPGGRGPYREIFVPRNRLVTFVPSEAAVEIPTINLSMAPYTPA